MPSITLLGFSCIGIFGVFLMLLADRLGWPTFQDFMLHSATAAWIQAVGSIGAIIAATWVVHRQHALHQQATEAERLSDRVDAINGMMFVLMRQLNTLIRYRGQILEPHRGDPARHFTLPPTLPVRRVGLDVDWAQFAYLSRTSAVDALPQLMLADEAFHLAVDAINQRNEMHRTELQPRLESNLMELGSGLPEALVAQLAGPRLTHTLKTGTESAYELTDFAIDRLTSVGQSAAAAIRSAYPGHQINGFGPAQPPTPPAEGR